MSEIDLCSREDFEEIHRDLEDFWGSDRTRAQHHPMFLEEFRNSAFVIREQGRVAAYLFGFFAQTSPTAYVHLVGVRKKYRRLGMARRLYERFMDLAKEYRFTALKSITSPANADSIAFHRSLGMSDEIVKDYSGPGEDRVIFFMRL